MSENQEGSPQEELNEASSLAQAGKYLTFALGKEDYGLEILKVREIIGLMEITTVPQVPSYVKGVINLRGKVIPVIDLRLKFGMEEFQHTAETCIIVVTIKEILIGIIIDRVKEVLDIIQDNIEPPPSFGSTINTDFILGIGKVSDSVKMLLNIERIVGNDLTLIQQQDASE